MESRKAKSRRDFDEHNAIHPDMDGVEVDPSSVQVISGDNAPFALDVSDITHDDFNRHYDLTPLNGSENGSRGRAKHRRDRRSFSIDPWEIKSPENEDDNLFCGDGNAQRQPSRDTEPYEEYSEDDISFTDRQERRSADPKFLIPEDIHPNMEQRDEDIAQLRLLAGKLKAEWGGQEFMAPSLARRIRDFQFAQEKRRKKYGDERPWGILGLYDHLASIRVDVEWAEDAALRRANGESYLSWADYDASKNVGVNRPFFTYFLLLTCTVALVASIALNGWVVQPLSENPMIGPSAQTLIRMGAKSSSMIVNENEAWRLLSAAILHAGLAHYLINSLALWFVGKAIETTHGSIAAAIIFVIPAVGGTILSAIFLPEYITVGASGGIFGLIGACLSDIMMNWKLLFSDFVTENGRRHSHAMVIIFLLFDIVLNCVIGLTPYVDNFTHLGGMTIGLLCGLSTMERLSSDFFGMEENCWSQTKHAAVRFLGVILSILGIIIATIILLEGDGETTPCPNCTWLSCVPFPPWEGQTDKWWYCDDCDAVTARIVESPTLHLQVDCPDGTNVAVGLNADEDVSRERLEQELPSYCREFCVTN